MTRNVWVPGSAFRPTPNNDHEIQEGATPLMSEAITVPSGLVIERILTLELVRVT